MPDGDNKLRRNYVGTLRSVLQSWGNDYGFDFSYGFLPNEIIGINLRNPVLNIETIKNTIKAADDLTGFATSPIIETMDESASLEGTYRKYHATIYRKDAKVRNYSKTIYNQARFSPLRLADIMSLPSDPVTGRYNTYDEFYTSCILATLSNTLWFYYNFKTKNSFDTSTLTDERKRANALKRSARIFGTTSQGEVELKQAATANTYKGFLEKLFLTQKAIGENFINQYCVNFQFSPTKRKYCAGNSLDVDFNAQFSDDVETFYKAGNVFPNAFPSYYSLMEGIYSQNLYPVSTIVTNYLGYYGAMTVNAANFLNRRGQYLNVYSLANLNKLNNDFLKFSDITVDPVDGIKDVKDVLSYFAIKANTVNINFVADRVNTKEVRAGAVTSATPCQLSCEQDFVSEVCDFNRCLGPGQRTDQEWPKGLVGTVKGDTLKISFTPADTDPATVPPPQMMYFFITNPSYAAYQTNIIYQFNNRYVMPGAKKVLAGVIDKDPPVIADFPGNVSAIDFSTLDVTSDIDTYFDNTTNAVVTNLLMPYSSGSGSVITVEDYDAALRATDLATATVSNVRKTFKFSVPGMLAPSFSGILTPEKGLVGFDINYDDKGLTTTYSYATRPPKPPQKEEVFNRISPSFSR